MFVWIESFHILIANIFALTDIIGFVSFILGKYYLHALLFHVSL